MSKPSFAKSYVYFRLLTRLSGRLIAFAALLNATLCSAQQQGQAQRDQPEPDVLIFNNGDRLTGTLDRSNGSSVVFKSDMAGEVTVDWSKVKQLQTNHSFALIPKNVEIKRGGSGINQVMQGRISVADQKITVSSPDPEKPSRVVPTGESAYLVNQDVFDKAVLSSPGLFHDWNGSLTFGTTLVQATQNNTTFSGGATLLRVTPTETWIARRDRTALNFNFAYGKLSQPNTPDVKTEILHLDGERDQYFSPRLYLFGQFAFDHNYSQGLDLQQTYAGGLGWTVIKNPVQELDLKAGVGYVKQQFQFVNLDPNAPPDQNPNVNQNQDLIGSNFAENYSRKLIHNITLTQLLSATPTWNNLNAYSGSAQVGLSIPVYRRFALTLEALDNFINNPPLGFRKNSFQFTTAITYTMK